jgi:hypothetical protein
MFKKMITDLLEMWGYVRHSQYATVVYENEKLNRELTRTKLKNRDLDALNLVISQELKILTDENQSLWDMLDETKNSQTFGKAQMKSAMEDLQEILTEEMLKDFKPVGEA